LLIEALTSLCIRLPDREVSLIPGQRVDLSNEHGHRLLEKVGNKVRRLSSPDSDESIVIEPASPTARPIYWEAMDGTWHGPVKPEFLGRTLSGHKERFWVIVTYNGNIRWIWSDLLRTVQASEGSDE
jgi:hypothetical protein